MIIFIFLFLASYFSLKVWEYLARKIGIVGKDLHKISKPEIPEAGGIPIFLLFFLINYPYILKYPYLLSSFLGFLIGLTDDLLRPRGLPWKAKFLLSFIPVIVVLIPTFLANFGFSFLSILFFLILLVLGVGWTNAVNTLAGFNGVEICSILPILIYLAFCANSYEEKQILAKLIIILIPFLFENWCPAKIFPGDSFTYGAGALISAYFVTYLDFRGGIAFLLPYLLNGYPILFFLFYSFLGKKVKLEKHDWIIKGNGVICPTKKEKLLEFIAFLISKRRKACREDELAFGVFLIQMLILLILLAL